MAKDRILPQSIEAEQSLLGSLLIDQNAGITVFSEIKEEDFYSEVHKIIFSAMFDLYSANSPIDIITLSDYLVRKDLTSKIGDLSYISTLSTIIPSAANFRSYMQIVKRCSTMRKLIDASQKIINNCFEGDDAQDAKAYAEKLIFDIGKEDDNSSLAQISESLDELIDRLDRIYRDPNSLKGISTGFVGIDNLTNGLQKSDLIILAARPSVGKTSLALNIAVNAALDQNAKVAVFSLEMPKIQLANRMLCDVAGVSMEKVKKGKQSKEDWQALFAAKKKLAAAQIYVDDSSMNKPIDVLNKCRRIKREKGLDLVIIDYLQLMTSDKGSKDGNRVTEVSDISRSLKITARELDVPIIVLSQLSRAVEGRKDHRPIMSDLRESGSIEQDADMVWFIHRPDKYADLEVADDRKNIAELIVAKHRNGELGTIDLRWVGELTAFRNAGRDSNLDSLYKTAPADKKPVNPEMPTDKDAPPEIESVGGDLEDLF